MSVLQLLVYDFADDFDDEPTTLTTLDAWLARRPFALSSQTIVGLRLRNGSSEHFETSFGWIPQTAAGCRTAAGRLAAGKLALLRTATDNPGVYLLLSADDPVRVGWVHERPPIGDVYPFGPGRSFDPPNAAEQLHAWAELEADRLLAPSENPAFDRARALHLRVPRGQVISDLVAQAKLAEELYRVVT